MRPGLARWRTSAPPETRREDTVNERPLTPERVGLVSGVGLRNAHPLPSLSRRQPPTFRLPWRPLRTAPATSQPHDSSPALNANAAGSPKSPTWGEMAQERPPCPGGAANGNASVVHTMTPPRSPPPAASPPPPVASSPPPDPAPPRPPTSSITSHPPNTRPSSSAAPPEPPPLPRERLAEKAKKARAKAERKKQGGKLLLQQLQDEAGAKDPSLLPGVIGTRPQRIRGTCSRR